METDLSLEEKVDKLLAYIERFLPLIERFEQAAKANGRLNQRKIMKGMG
jgi:hypothetical protein